MTRFLVLGISFLWLSFSVWAKTIQLPVVTERRVIEDNFNQPSSVVTAADGTLFVLDSMNRRVAVFSDDGQKLFDIRPNKAIPDFYQATGITWSQGFLYIADSKNQRILEITDKGEFSRVIKLPDIEFNKVELDKKAIPLKSPVPVAVSIFDQSLFYSDRANHRFCLINLVDMSSTFCTGKRGEQNGEFQFPFQIGIDSDGFLHIVDVVNGRVQLFNQRGEYYSQIGRFGLDQLYRPNGIALDPLGYSYISDAYLGVISVFREGRYFGRLKDEDGHIVKFKSPSSLWYDSKGLYVIDGLQNQLVILQLGYIRHDKKALDQLNTHANFSRKNCVACHATWSESGAELKDAQGIIPVASLSMCYSCHRGVVFESRHAVPQGGQHPTIYDAEEKKKKRQDNLPRKDDIPEAFPLLANDELSCVTCHTPHNPDEEQPTLYEYNDNSWMRVLNKNSKICEDCHKSKTKEARERDEKLRGINHPLGFHLSRPKTKRREGYSKDPHLQKGLPVSLIQRGAMLGENDQMVCQTCHQIHGGSTDGLLVVKEEVLCGECHKRQSPKGKKGARKAGVHPVNIELEKPVEFRGEKVKKVVCKSCHSVHDGAQGTPLFPDKIKRAEKLCIACHKQQHAKDKEDAAIKGIHVMNEELDEPVKIGNQKVKNIGCLSCHSVHNGKPYTPALIENHKDGQLCEKCHTNKQRVVGTDHDLRVTAKKSENRFEENPHQSGVCGSCHSMHRGEGKQPYLYAAKVLPQKKRDESAPHLKTDELCLNCHQDRAIAEDKRIEYYGHPYKDILLRSDKKVMPLLALKTEKIEEFGVISCITCHDPHVWSPEEHNPGKYKVIDYKFKKNEEGTVLNSFLLRKGVTQTFCISCHDIEALAKYKYFHHKEKVRDIGVDYIE
jgi:predicted CXXCH cytochrome family protein